MMRSLIQLGWHERPHWASVSSGRAQGTASSSRAWQRSFLVVSRWLGRSEVRYWEEVWGEGLGEKWKPQDGGHWRCLLAAVPPPSQYQISKLIYCLVRHHHRAQRWKSQNAKLGLVSCLYAYVVVDGLLPRPGVQSE